MNTNLNTNIQTARRYIRQLHTAIIKGDSFHIQYQLVKKLRRIQKKLQSKSPTLKLRRVLASTAFVLMLASGTQAQTFALPKENPIEFKDISILFNLPTFADLDDDGDLDMISLDFYTNGHVNYYENTGSKDKAHFERFDTAKCRVPLPKAARAVKFADIDGDGDFDMFVASYNKFYLYENKGNSKSPIFEEAIENPYNFQFKNSIPYFDILDLNGDGALDLLILEYYVNNIHFFKNIGTKTEPKYDSSMIDPFGLGPSPLITTFISLTSGDLDKDGDIDILKMSTKGELYYYENIGSSTDPKFTEPIINPFGIKPLQFSPFPVLVDLDNDNDLDLILTVWKNIYYYENISSTGMKPTFKLAETLTVYPNPAKNCIQFKNLKSGVIKIDVFDINGKHIKSSTLVSNPKITNYDISDLFAGNYLIRLTQNEKVSIAKFTIQ